MKKIIWILAIFTMTTSLLTSCCKWTNDKRDIYNFVPPPAQPINSDSCLHDYIKGTMLSGKTYNVCKDIVVKSGDTLTVQPGVTINFNNHSGLVVQGTLLSLGTQAQPIYFTVPNQIKTDDPGKNPKNDSAFASIWKGVIGDTSCKTMIFKWTHIEYSGAACATAFIAGILGTSKVSKNCYAIFFPNSNGNFVFEDSWIYGCNDDAIRLAGGRFEIFRSTFEKCGKNGGDVLNVKGNCSGDMAYNLFVGDATNGLKASDIGETDYQTNVRIYNNTIVNCGYRQTQAGRGGSINFEQNAAGMAYNNLIINCRYGLRVVSNPIADTSRLFYGYNYSWADTTSVANQIYPVAYITKPQPTDYPNPSTFLPTNFNYFLNNGYDGTNAVKVGNPLFTNYPLPLTNGLPIEAINAVGKFKFTLNASSPCVGKGYKGFSPLALVPIDPNYGATEITQPGSDMGCFQINRTGNQHF